MTNPEMLHIRTVSVGEKQESNSRDISSVESSRSGDATAAATDVKASTRGRPMAGD